MGNKQSANWVETTNEFPRKYLQQQETSSRFPEPLTIWLGACTEPGQGTPLNDSTVGGLWHSLTCKQLRNLDYYILYIIYYIILLSAFRDDLWICLETLHITQPKKKSGKRAQSIIEGSWPCNHVQRIIVYNKFINQVSSQFYKPFHCIDTTKTKQPQKLPRWVAHL